MSSVDNWSRFDYFSVYLFSHNTKIVIFVDMKAKMIKEKGTNEVYPSKKAMRIHEQSESKSTERMEQVAKKKRGFKLKGHGIGQNC
jgi:hypothetical protein